MKLVELTTFYDFLNSSAPFFINRLNGSDFKTMVAYQDGRMTTEEAIKIIGIWNGYYDTSSDNLTRKHNLLTFFKKLEYVYANNLMQISTLFTETYPTYSDSLTQVSYVSYNICQGPTLFKTLLTTKLCSKTVLIVSAFTEQLKLQEK